MSTARSSTGQRKNMETKVMPHDYEAEKLVLGTVMAERNALDEVRDLLTPDTFYGDLHAAIYRAILGIDARGERADMITVMNELRKTQDVPPYEFALIAGYSTFDVRQHAALLHDKEKRRRFFEIGQYLTQNCFNEATDIVDVLSEARGMMDGLLQAAGNNIASMHEAVEGVYTLIDRNQQTGSHLTGDPTGFGLYDEKSGGLQKSDLVIIAADTSMGKTSLALSMVMNTGCPVAVYSMEMKKEQIAARMIAMESGVPANEILYARLTQRQIAWVDKGVARVVGHPVYFDDRSTSNIDTILASIRMMKLRYAISGAVVDYLQILNVNMKGVSKEQQMGDVARRLKNLAKELDIWIIALSQLNRDAQNPVPTLNRLRDSGQIAEAADVVMLIYRPEVYGRYYPEPYQSASTKGTALIDIAKGRNIGLLRFLCRFDKPVTRFADLSDKEPLSREEEEEEEEEPF